MKKIILFVILFLTTPYVLRPTPYFAVPMDSSRFKIESVNVGVGGGNNSSDGYNLSDTVGQLAAGEYLSTGYVVKSGFQHTNSTLPFRFTISDVNVNLGNLISNKPSIGTTNLSVHFGNIGQYQVTAIEEGPLKTQSKNAIPDTSCNAGNNACSESLANIWTSNSAYGFGYGVSGDDTPTDFIDKTYFRPFPDFLAKASPTTIMSSSNFKKNRSSTITFKVNTSSVQPAGSYQTVINFVALPSY